MTGKHESIYQPVRDLTITLHEGCFPQDDIVAPVKERRPGSCVVEVEESVSDGTFKFRERDI